MRISIEKLYKTDYTVEYLGMLRQPWKKTNSFSCLDAPKEQELFLYLDGYDAEYEFPNGTKRVVKSGSLVYTAHGSRYKVKFVNPRDERCSTVGINFYLYGEDGQRLSLSEDLLVFHTNNEIVSAIETAEQYLCSPIKNTKARFKAMLLQILSELGENSRFFTLHSESGYSVVARAIHYLDVNSESNTSVAELAALCHVSETYLRILFQKFTGTSPTQYRIRLRMKKAQTLLLYGNIPVGEIAELLGFSNTAYFIKLFKRTYGCTPFAYRKQTAL